MSVLICMIKCRFRGSLMISTDERYPTDAKVITTFKNNLNNYEIISLV